MQAARSVKPWAVPQYDAPWRVECLDERVVILARDGEKVVEVQPGQVNGRIPPKEERIALGQRIVDAVNG